MSALSPRKIKHLLGWTGEASKLHMTAGKTLTIDNTLEFAGTDSTVMTFPGTSDTVVTLAASQTLTNKTLSNPIITGAISGTTNKIVTAEVDVTSSAALVAITGIAIPLVAGGTYLIEGYMPGTSGASGGAKFSFDTSDTLTVTSMSLTGTFNTAAGSATITTTSFQTGIGSTAAVIYTDLAGTIVVNAAGTLTVKFAQNASNGTASSVYVNGWVKATRIA